MAKKRTPTLQVRVLTGMVTCDSCKAAEKFIPGSKELDTLFELFLRATGRNDTNSVIYVHYTCLRLAMRKAEQEKAKVNAASTGAPVIDAAIAAFEQGGDSEDR